MFNHFDHIFFDVINNNSFPPTDIFETKDGKLKFRFAVAGYSKEDITIDFKGNKLTVKSVNLNKEPEDENISGYFEQRIAKRRFEKSWVIKDSKYTNKDNISASMEDGILEIVIEKDETMQNEGLISIS